jgi:hypothetical protein
MYGLWADCSWGGSVIAVCMMLSAVCCLQNAPHLAEEQCFYHQTPFFNAALRSGMVKCFKNYCSHCNLTCTADVVEYVGFISVTDCWESYTTIDCITSIIIVSQEEL